MRIQRTTIIAMCLGFFAAAPVYGQDSTSTRRFTFPDSTLRINKIQFAGNEVTQDYIILREMTLQPGTLLTYADLEYDINRIYSLQLFSRVDIEVVEESAGAILLVLLSERWYFFPYPVAGFRDRDWNRLYIGAGVAHTNVGGRNERFNSEFAVGYDPYAQFYYSDPLISKMYNLFASVRGQYAIKRNRSLVSKGSGVNFDEKRFVGEIVLGKRFTIFSSIAASVEYDRIAVSDHQAGRTLSPTGTDQFAGLNLSYSYDTRDLYEYPNRGTVIRVGFSKLGLGGGEVDYQRYHLDVRRYTPVNSLINIAFRFFGNLAQGGTVPNYGHVFFGYNERIRGHFNDIIEGEQILGSMMELHVPILSPRYMRLDFIPFDQFKDVRYAIYGAAFFDAGNVWYRNQPLTMDRTQSGYGFGIHFLLSYSLVLRAEYARSTSSSKEQQLILEAGAAL